MLGERGPVGVGRSPVGAGGGGGGCHDGELSCFLAVWDCTGSVSWERQANQSLGSNWLDSRATLENIRI